MKMKAVTGILLILFFTGILAFNGIPASAGLLVRNMDTGLNYATTKASSPNDWPMFRHDASHTGVAEGPVPTNETAWKYKTRSFSYPWFMWHSSPAIVDGTVFVGCLDSYVYALDATTGNLKWEFKTGSWVDSSPAVYEGKVYVGSWDNNVYCLNGSSGFLIWQYPTGGYIISSPTVVNGRVFIGSRDGHLHCINATTGEPIWKYHASDFAVESSPAVSDGRVVVGSHGWYDEGRIYCFNETNGNVLWSFQTVSDIHSSPVIANGTIFIAGDSSIPSPILAIDLFSGSIRWSFPIPALTPASPAVENGKLFINAGDGYVYSLNATNGELLWKYDRGGAIRWETSPAVVDGTVIVGCEDGYLYWLNESDGSLIQRYEVGSPIMSSPSVSNGKVYFSSDNGYIYAVGYAPIRMLSIELSGELDYRWRESVKIRLSALVKDADTMEPVSDANVTLDIYKPDGKLMTSGMMTEQIPHSGVYEWQSERTIRELRLEKGVYLVHVKVSHLGATISGILEFHIDPPSEEPIQLNLILLFVLATALVIAISVWYVDHRRLSRKLSELQRRMPSLSFPIISVNVSTNEKSEHSKKGRLLKITDGDVRLRT